MITLKWVDAQIEDTLRGTNTAKNIYDLGMLYIVRDHLAASDREPHTYSNNAGPAEERRQTQEDEPMLIATDPYGGQAPHTHGIGTLPREAAEIWVESLIGADGTRGPRWSMADVRSMAEQRGYTTEAEQVDFWAVINMLRSDFCEVAKRYSVNSPEFFADLARAWINDPDAVEDKAAQYMEFIAR